MMTSLKSPPSFYRSLLLAIPIAIALILLGLPLYRLSLGTPLLKAIADQDPERVASLLRRGAPPDASDGDGNTALALAFPPRSSKEFYNTLSPKREQIAELLLNAGADANRTVPGASYLFLAIEIHSLPLVKDLLAHGADPNAVSMGDPVLLEAIYADLGGDRAEFTHALLAAGASPHTRQPPSIKADTSLVIPIGEEPPLLVAVLITPPNSYPLQRGTEAVIEALLASGVDVNTRDRNGQFALVMAAAMGNPYIVRVLLTHGADPSLRDRQGRTALEEAQAGLKQNLAWSKKAEARRQELLASARKRQDSRQIEILTAQKENDNAADLIKRNSAVENLLRDATFTPKQ